MAKKSFEIHYADWTIIDAKDVNDARKKFKRAFPNTKAHKFVCEQTDEVTEAIGYCEISGLPIFKTDEYESDGEGIMWLKSKL